VKTGYRKGKSSKAVCWGNSRMRGTYFLHANISAHRSNIRNPVQIFLNCLLFLFREKWCY